MNIEHNEHGEHEAALDKVLAALRDAVPPEGMETRIAHRLQEHATAPPAAPFRWRDLFANSAITSAWWRGAITGAAAVLLMAGVPMFVGHLLRSRPDRIPMASNTTTARGSATSITPMGNSTHGIPVSETYSPPCPHPAILRTAIIVPANTSTTLRAETYTESAAPSHPAPELPLTDQERALVRLAKTATPKQLAVINPEEYAHLEAQSALKFERFFAPPAPIPETTPEANPEANPDVNQQASPEVVPPVNE